MPLTSISHQHRLLLDTMSILTIPLAWVNRMFVVEAFADRESLDDFVAHFASLSRWYRSDSGDVVILFVCITIVTNSTVVTTLSFDSTEVLKRVLAWCQYTYAPIYINKCRD